MNDSTVSISTGRLEGSTSPDGQVRSFLGVPYAAPPVGELRWRGPQPPAAWHGSRDARRFGPSARQPLLAANSLYYGGEREFSEDCLYLNVFTGAATSAGRPVMVWFHFGAFQFGSPSNPLYDGSQLARDGVTVVTVGHRLGRFGFLVHPWLSAESGTGGSGNYGLLDQVEALRWVQRNIGEFGGDPDNVTVFGLSAGGHSVHNLRTSPLAAGLFHRAVAHSGPGVAPARDGLGHPANPCTLAAAESAGQELTDLLSVTSPSALRALPPEAVEATGLPRAAGRWQFDLLPTDGVGMAGFDTGYPVIDGHVLPVSPLTAYAEGTVADVPMLVGNAGNEGSGLPHLASLRDYRDYVEAEYGDLADEVLAAYPADSDAAVPEASRSLEGDRTFTWSSWTAARLQARSRTSPVWYFRFLHAPPIPVDSDVVERGYAGAFHGAELPYLFGTYDVWQWPWTRADHVLGEQLRATWTAFARTGDPNSELDERRRPSWPVVDPAVPSALRWDHHTTFGAGVDPERMALLDRFNGLTATGDDPAPAGAPARAG